MKLEFLLLSDAAVIASDGVFSTLNCGLDYFHRASFPATKPMLVVIARIMFFPEEMGVNQELRLEIFGPAGEVLAPVIPVSIVPIRNKRHPERPNHMTLSLAIFSVTFQTPGYHSFRLCHAEEVLGEHPFDVYITEAKP